MQPAGFYKSNKHYHVRYASRGFVSETIPRCTRRLFLHWGRKEVIINTVSEEVLIKAELSVKSRMSDGALFTVSTFIMLCQEAAQ